MDYRTVFNELRNDLTIETMSRNIKYFKFRQYIHEEKDLSIKVLARVRNLKLELSIIVTSSAYRRPLLNEGHHTGSPTLPVSGSPQ